MFAHRHFKNLVTVEYAERQLVYVYLKNKIAKPRTTFFSLIFEIKGGSPIL